MMTNEQLAKKITKVLNSNKSEEDTLLLLENKEVSSMILELNALALTLPKKEKEAFFILISALSEIALDRNRKETRQSPVGQVTGDKRSVLDKLRKKD